jgi:truncated hemoglobin YjbI
MKPKTLSPDRKQLKLLIESIGGETALFRILLSFYERMAKDPMIGYFFEGKPIPAIAGKQGEFILMAAGLLQKFEGKGPASAHSDLPPIYEGHFDRRLILLRETLQKEGLSDSEIGIWLRFEESFRSLVVTRT